MAVRAAECSRFNKFDSIVACRPKTAGHGIAPRCMKRREPARAGRGAIREASSLRSPPIAAV
jgi:hypothetical protein